jgi:hypothetical protein
MDNFYDMDDVTKIALSLEEINYFSTKEDGEHSRQEYLDGIKYLVYQRMIHCSSELSKHLKDAKMIHFGQTIVWDGGHFSLPVYQYMCDFVQNYTCTDESYRKYINPMVLQQALRALEYEEMENKHYLFMCLTEELLVVGRGC